jgi:hypothetical protein
MRWLNRTPAMLTGAIVAMSILLLLVLAGSVALWRYNDGPPLVQGLGTIFGLLGAGMAWPLSALIAAAMLLLLALAGVHTELRTRRRGTALLLGAAALHAAWLFGIRPPGSRTGVFEGQYVYGHLGIRPDLFIPCQDASRPLAAGADLLRGAMEPGMRVMAAVHLPESGWHGSHPRDWPSTDSDIHGTQYWLVRVRGRLVGPGQYGWPPALQYRLKVDSVLSVASKRMFQDECGVDDPPPNWPPSE